MKHNLGWSILALGCCSLLALGCRPKVGAGGEEGGGLPPPEKAATPCGPEGLVDDMEDNNNQVMVQAGRSGYWYTYLDDAGTTVEPTAGASFTMTDGGANGSAYAVRFWGTIATAAIVYAGAGCSFTDPKEAYDASKYGGISFFAKKGTGSGKMKLKVPDSATDPDGNVCKECYNDFGVELELTAAWTKYVVPYSVMRQESGWGSPLTGAINPSKLYGVQFQANVPGEQYDIWIDDLAFTGCQ